MSISRDVRILAVLPYVPFPATSGGTQRTLELCAALAGASELTVLAVSQPGQDLEGFRSRVSAELVPVSLGRKSPGEWMDALKQLRAGVPITYLRYLRRQLAAPLSELLRNRRFDVVHFDHLHTAQLLPLVRTLQPRARVVIDEHNVESVLYRELATKHSNPVLRAALKWQHGRVEALERRLVSEADAVVTCSDADATRVRAMGGREVRVVPNGTSQVPPAGNGPRNNVVFVGSFDWMPNEDAAIRLARQVWPKVERELAPSQLMLVGRSPPPSVRQLAGRNVVVTGTVKSVDPFLGSAWATAMPLRTGSGTRLKILEAAAAGVPIVASAIAIEGLAFDDGKHFLRAETNEEFAGALKKLRTTPALADALRTAAFETVQRYSWKGIGNELAQHYAELTPRSDQTRP